MSAAADEQFMELALNAARAAATAWDYPVSAALVVDGVLWGTARNALFSAGRTTDAEHPLIAAQSARLGATVRGRLDADVQLFATLEPCLMCLGIAVDRNRLVRDLADEQAEYVERPTLPRRALHCSTSSMRSQDAPMGKAGECCRICSRPLVGG